MGAVLLLVSGLMAFVWFIWLAPVRHIYSIRWIQAHSRSALWEESQKSVGRIGVTHDVGVEMGRWGDKEWAVWIINHIKPGQNIAGCENSHLGEALADITNHQLKPDSEVWLAWWKTNQNKTQIEWIREGFAERGLILQDPLTTNNIIELIKLAHLATNSPAYTNTPDYLRGSLRLNAFRWLRDSGINFRDAFGIWGCDINNIPEIDRNRIASVLFDYAEWYGEYWDGPGKLPLKKDYGIPVYFQYESAFQKCKWIVYFTIPLFTVVGIWLIRRQPTK
jgi:hypothetical protein